MYLNCKSYYSFRYGTFSTEELVRAAVEKGVPTLALTNINSTYDLWEFVNLCRKHHIKPVCGVEVRNEDTLLYLLLAATNAGLAWIHQFLSDHLIAKKKFPAPADDPSFFNVPRDGFVIYPLDAKPFDELKVNERIGIKPW
ncbi:MAG TPA: PHP domain-containing protein, partial [Hanamia sp.]|nr:PHP domain-containing protein [Hanamia sp.]